MSLATLPQTITESRGGALAESRGKALMVGAKTRHRLFAMNNLNICQELITAFVQFYIFGDDDQDFFPGNEQGGAYIDFSQPSTFGFGNAGLVAFLKQFDPTFTVYTMCHAPQWLLDLMGPGLGVLGIAPLALGDVVVICYALTASTATSWTLAAIVATDGQFVPVQLPFTQTEYFVAPGISEFTVNGFFAVASESPLSFPGAGFGLNAYLDRKGCSANIFSPTTKGVVSIHDRLAGNIWKPHRYAKEVPSPDFTPPGLFRTWPELNFQCLGSSALAFWIGKTTADLPAGNFNPVDYNLFMMQD
jgi:hypothetical protein